MKTENLENSPFPYDFTIEDVRLEIETRKIDDDERLVCSHSAVIKRGKQSYQIATCLEIVNEHTGELHHYGIEIHNIHKYKKKGWVEKEKYRINDLSVFEALQDFLTLIKEEKLGKTDRKRYLISETDYALLNGLDNTDNQLVHDILKNPKTYNQLIEEGDAELVKDLLQIILKKQNAVELIQKLKELDVELLKELNTVAGISQLKSVYEIWNTNKENGDEEFWQRTLSENSWVISQLFSSPVVLFAGKAYVGGKWIDNRGGNVVDFIYQNNLTENIIQIEIKTPKTKLIGKPYRKTFSPSAELSGSCNQILNYKQKLTRSYGNIISDNPEKPRFDNFNPRCLVIIGSFEDELQDSYRKKEAFELYRSNLNGTDVITFDELFKKVDILINLLEGK